MTIRDEEAFWAAVRVDFFMFLRMCFKTVYPDEVFLDNWHIHAIAYQLQLCLQGKRTRLIINLPPRHLKSFIVSVVWPAWILAMSPTKKIICISYSEELAKILARDFKRIVESEWYPKLFPHVRAANSTASEFVTTDNGFRLATSVTATLTGRGADYLIIDDSIKPAEALSDTPRNAVNEWFRSTAYSRLNDKARSVLAIVMQRLHINDLTGFAQDGGGFHKLSFPAIAIRDEDIPLSDTEVYRRRRGEPLQAERESLEVLRGIRDQIHPFFFSAQYQQHPEAPDGGLIKRHYLKVIDEKTRILGGGIDWISIDTAASNSETSDHTAIVIGYSNRVAHYVLNVIVGRFSYETLKDKVLQLCKEYEQDPYLIVENSNAGASLIPDLRSRGMDVFSFNPRKDKMTRVALVLPIFLAGRVFIRNVKGENAWFDPLINELTTFPHSRFDDQVDALVQALSRMEQRIHGGLKRPPEEEDE